MVSNEHIFFGVLLTTNVTPIHSFKVLFINLSHNQWFVEVLPNDSFAVFNLFKHLFHKFVDSVFTSINANVSIIFIIIASYYLISIAIVFVSLIGFGVRSLILLILHFFTLLATLYLFCDSLKIGIYYKRNWKLFVKVIEL